MHGNGMGPPRDDQRSSGHGRRSERWAQVIVPKSATWWDVALWAVAIALAIIAASALG